MPTRFTSFRRWLPLLVWGGVAIATLIGITQAIDLRRVWESIQSASIGWVLLAFGTIIATQVLKGLRWQFLLRAHQITPSLQELVRVQLIGQGLNTFLPLRVGEVARVQWMYPYDRALVFSTIVIEKSADLLCFGVMGIALAVSTTLPDTLNTRVRDFTLTTVVVLAAAGLVLLLSRESWLERIMAKIAFLRPVLTLYLRFRNGWRQITRPRDALLLVLWSGAIWGMAIATNICLLVAFGLPFDWVAATVLLVVLQIGITVVTLPATIGIFEYLCVLTLGWFGVWDTTAFGVGIVLHLLVLIPSALGIWWARPRGAATPIAPKP